MTPTEIVNFLSTAPFHTILLIAILVLWRRVISLEKRLEECLEKP